MSDQKQQQERSFFEELKRRHVVGASLAYIIASWVILQVVDVLGDAFGAPGWTMRALTTVMILLFPAFVVFSWEFDLTRHGLERTGEDLDRGFSARPWVRRSIVGMVWLASLAAIWWTWQAGVLTDESFVKKDDDFPKIIAVDTFQTFAEEGSEWLGGGVANLVRDNLAQSRYLRVISLRRWRALTGSGSDDDPVTVAADADIDYLIQGEIISSRTGHVLTVRLTDTRDGEQLDAQTYEVQEEASLLDRATSIAQNARARLKVPVQERVDVFAADFAAGNPGAYRAFTGALDYWVNWEYAQSERLFEAAIELQPDYAMARYYLALNLADQDRLAEATEVLDQAVYDSDTRDGKYIEALRSHLARDVEKSIPAYEALIEEFPFDTELRWLLGSAHELAWDTRAAADQYEMLTTLEPEIAVAWSGLAYYLIQLGDYENARPALQRFTELAPDNAHGYVLRGDLNRAEDRLDDAQSDYRKAIELGSELQDAVVSLGKTQYLLGDRDAALDTYDTLIRDHEALPRYRIDAVFDAGGILNGLGRFEQHVAYLDLLDEELKASGIFWARALADKAVATMAINGPDDNVRQLIDDSIEASPGVPTRYLFARALFELQLEDTAAVQATADDIRQHALPPDDPDRTEDKAADYLMARAAMLGGDTDKALQLFASAASLDGYEYRLYALEHARALIAAGRVEDAMEILRTHVDNVDRVDPRLDLEYDRAHARELLETL